MARMIPPLPTTSRRTSSSKTRCKLSTPTSRDWAPLLKGLKNLSEFCKTWVEGYTRDGPNGSIQVGGYERDDPSGFNTGVRLDQHLETQEKLAAEVNAQLDNLRQHLAAGGESG